MLSYVRHGAMPAALQAALRQHGFRREAYLRPNVYYDRRDDATGRIDVEALLRVAVPMMEAVPDQPFTYDHELWSRVLSGGGPMSPEAESIHRPAVLRRVQRRLAPRPVGLWGVPSHLEHPVLDLLAEEADVANVSLHLHEAPGGQLNHEARAAVLAAAKRLLKPVRGWLSPWVARRVGGDWDSRLATAEELTPILELLDSCDDAVLWLGGESRDLEPEAMEILTLINAIPGEKRQ